MISLQTGPGPSLNTCPQTLVPIRGTHTRLPVLNRLQDRFRQVPTCEVVRTPIVDRVVSNAAAEQSGQQEKIEVTDKTLPLPPRAIEDIDDDELANLLLAWYYSGFFTGKFQVSSTYREREHKFVSSCFWQAARGQGPARDGES